VTLPSATLMFKDTEFAIRWRHRHPEMATFDELFADEYEFDRPWAKRTAARVNQWRELERRLPSRFFEIEIDRKQAFAILAYFWLPKEFSEEVEALI
jgi:hypothetical protein